MEPIDGAVCGIARDASRLYSPTSWTVVTVQSAIEHSFDESAQFVGERHPQGILIDNEGPWGVDRRHAQHSSSTPVFVVDDVA